MSLLSTYTQFLASPAANVLADDASINYIPTLTTINDPASIIKHLAAQAKVLTKKSEQAINSFESDGSLCVEFGSTIEFLSGGGALLPGLDDNFLADKTVVLPMIHVVQFTSLRKIRQIRIYWDQGSLLKQIEVIGSRARNWPIRDGKDQIRLISSNAGAEAQSTANSRRSTTSSSAASTSATGDPHATLSLFKPRDAAETGTPRKTSSGIAPRSAAKPPSRDLTDILSGNDKDEVIQPGSTMRPPSPRKKDSGAPKAGAGKNYHDIRLFDESDPIAEQKSPEKRTNPLKFSHFDFGNGESAPTGKTPTVKSKHGSQWNFEDFVTPDKPRMKVMTHNKKNFGWSDDEEAEKSPIQRPIVHAARPDAEPHFEFVDDGTPAANKQKHFGERGRSHNDGLGLYKNNVIEDSEEDPAEAATKAKKPLSTATTNVKLDSRHKDFDPQFDMVDSSPSVNRTSAPVTAKKDPNQARVIKGLDAQWGIYDESPDAVAKKENRPRGIRTGGDGMGGKTGLNRGWGFGDDSDPEEGHARKVVKERGNNANAASSKANEAKSFWDF